MNKYIPTDSGQKKIMPKEKKKDFHLTTTSQACSCSFIDETASQTGLEDFLRLRFVNDLAYGVRIVPCCPGNLQQGVKSSREEAPGRI